MTFRFFLSGSCRLTISQAYLDEVDNRTIPHLSHALKPWWGGGPQGHENRIKLPHSPVLQSARPHMIDSGEAQSAHCIVGKCGQTYMTRSELARSEESTFKDTIGKEILDEVL